MTATATATASDDAALHSPIVVELIRQMRALDTYDTRKDWPDSRLIDPFVLTRERKQALPIIGDPDEATLARIKAYYNALASLIEKRSGRMATPLVNLTHEGFGRALLTVGKLLVVDKTLRDAHRFGFASLSRLVEESGKLLDKALEMIGRFPEAADA